MLAPIRPSPTIPSCMLNSSQRKNPALRLTAIGDNHPRRAEAAQRHAETYPSPSDLPTLFGGGCQSAVLALLSEGQMTALACEDPTPYPHQAIAGPQLRSERGISTR
jgi:hypothetical protein